ncbi:MFS transporter [Lichenicola sp.]|uniref:MFS transporter n=1 Tax=Lichenicola sp. TaxID=2804529 RepID=UPI003B00395D
MSITRGESAAQAPAASQATAGAGTMTRVRWAVVGLLFAATVLNYMDRQVIGILKPVLQQDLHWNDLDYGHIVFFFQAAYAVGYAGAGRLIDLIGVRWGLFGAVLVWSIAAVSHALVATVGGFAAVRMLLGLGEGGGFPSAIKAIGEWFPRRDRALATGLFNSGSNIGALITPLLVPLLTVHYGWRCAFAVTGGLGLLWLVAWLAFYRPLNRNPRVSATERAYIASDTADALPPVKESWIGLLRHRAVWAYVVGTFLTSPVWWFYLFWVPDFLHRSHGLNISQMGLPLVTIYLMTDVGSIAGGWLSSALIRRGMSPLAARKVAFLVCALCVVPIFLAPILHGLWPATLLIGLAAAAHQGFSANLYTMASDTNPPNAVASVVGLGGMAGAIGGMGVAEAAGVVLQATGSYVILFGCAAGAYLLALLLMHLILPRMPRAAA